MQATSGISADNSTMSKPVAKKERIVVFSVSAGSGHVRAAQALQSTAEKWYPDTDVLHIDLMELVPKLFRALYTETYIKVVEQHPALWGYLYDRTNHAKTDSTLSRLRNAIETLNTRELKSVLKDIQPDHVICTHFLPAQLLSRRIVKGRFIKPVWVQVTDFDAHALWIHKGMRGYFAAHDELAERISGRGIPGEHVHVTGIPIMPAFSAALSREVCSRELGLDPARKTLMMMSGGPGIGETFELAEHLLKVSEELQIVVIAGKNEKTLKRLKNLAARNPGRLVPVGYSTTVERIMAACDLVITKPGGLTSSECLATGLPMIIVSPIPGQEERNSDFLLENGVALKACDAPAVVWRVNLLLSDPGRLRVMHENARQIGRPDAARKVLDTVLGRSTGGSL
jgi:processive 1,2-diacylglycerol beta-glucosyltransferase